MWRLLSLLAVLGALKVLVPWPDVAALVLSTPHQADTRAISMRSIPPSVEMRHDRSQLLVQVRDAAP
jgi:hypothetical protein